MNKYDLINNKDLISFEMQNGYFDKYFIAIMNNENIVSFEKRKNHIKITNILPLRMKL